MKVMLKIFLIWFINNFSKDTHLHHPLTIHVNSEGKLLYIYLVYLRANYNLPTYGLAQI